MPERRKENNNRRAEDLYATWNVKVRDTIIFIVGVFGVINELFIVENPRPSILIFLGSLIGIPFVMGADEKRNLERDFSDSKNRDENYNE